MSLTDTTGHHSAADRVEKTVDTEPESPYAANSKESVAGNNHHTPDTGSKSTGNSQKPTPKSKTLSNGPKKKAIVNPGTQKSSEIPKSKSELLSFCLCIPSR